MRNDSFLMSPANGDDSVDMDEQIRQDAEVATEPDDSSDEDSDDDDSEDEEDEDEEDDSLNEDVEGDESDEPPNK